MNLRLPSAPRLPSVPRLPFAPAALHRSDRPSVTALGVCLWRALEADRPLESRIVDDPYARTFLPGGLRLAVPSLERAQPLLDLPERSSLTGMATYVLCRHRFIDDHLLEHASGVGDGSAEQVLLLGAGYDSRAYRLAGPLGGRPVFEVDLAPLSQLKARIVAKHPSQFGHTTVRRVETDFRTQTLTEALVGAGFVAGRRTFVVWEGVAPYLSAEAVHATLGELRALLGKGSVLTLDLWDGGGTGVLAPARRAAAWSLSLVGEPVTFRVPPLGATRLLGEHDFDVVDLAEAGTLTSRYATLGRRAGASLYVVAASLR